jgi:hypothetical protein
MVSPAIFGGIMSIFVIATVASKEYSNHSNNKRARRNELEYRRRMIQKRKRR